MAKKLALIFITFLISIPVFAKTTREIFREAQCALTAGKAIDSVMINNFDAYRSISYSSRAVMDEQSFTLQKDRLARLRADGNLRTDPKMSPEVVISENSVCIVKIIAENKEGEIEQIGEVQLMMLNQPWVMSVQFRGFDG